MSDKTLLVIDPEVVVPEPIAAALAEAGYIVLRCGLEEVHVVGSPSDALVLGAALEAIRDYSGVVPEGNGVRSLFGRRLAAALGYAEVVKLK
jgi:hypothetical protein